MAKSVIQCLKDIAYKLGLIADYVVETGTSGIWTYRKWNSGIAECWGTYIKTGPITAAWGNLYALQLNTTHINYPFTFIERPKEYANVHPSRNACWVYDEADGNGINTTTASGCYSVARPTPATTSNTVHLDLYVKGLWKQLGGGS